MLDIQLFIEAIESFFLMETKYERVNNNTRLKHAVERMFELVGKAKGNYKNSNQEIDICNAKKIVGLRNLIAHVYDCIDDPKLWAILIYSIPQLRIETDNVVKR